MSNKRVSNPAAAARLKAVDTAFRRHNRMLVRWLTRKLGDAETARDVAQSAYLRVWRHAETEIIENPQALLFKTAANLAANEFRARGRRRLIRVAGSSADADALREIPDEKPSPERELLSRDDLAASIAAINALAPAVRRAFLLSRLEHKNYREIAAELGVSESSIEKYIITALKALRAAVYDNRGETEPSVQRAASRKKP